MEYVPSVACILCACQQLINCPRLTTNRQQVQDGAATVAADAPGSRHAECFGVFCTTYDLKAVSRLTHDTIDSAHSRHVFVEMLHRLLSLGVRLHRLLSFYTLVLHQIKVESFSFFHLLSLALLLLWGL